MHVSGKRITPMPNPHGAQETFREYKQNRTALVLNYIHFGHRLTPMARKQLFGGMISIESYRRLHSFWASSDPHGAQTTFREYDQH